MIERYSNRLGDAAGPRGPSYDPEIPTPGCYRVKLRRDAPDSAVRIWLGPSIDPATGQEVQERSWFWQCEVNGQRVPLEQCWPGCARQPISREEHDRIVARNRTMDPSSPFYDPRKPIDLGRAPPPF
jgi:hypothetical protein